jgi:amino acid transporter
MNPTATPQLRRALGFWVLLLYGLGVIVGAGIYVLVGTVAAKAGMSAPLAFVVAALLAALTGLSYAELVIRVPEASGAAGYVHTAFGSALAARAVGFTVVAITVVSTATIASGSAGYLGAFVAAPSWLPAALSVAGYTVIACLKVEVGARFAAILSIAEICGLMFAGVLGADALVEIRERWHELLPSGQTSWSAFADGVFVAFFAYIGFETLANMAEETRNVARTLPRAILAAIALSAGLYFFLMLVAVLALPVAELAASSAPLCLLIEREGLQCGNGFAILALVALANGIIVQLMLAARQIYGLAERGLLPAWFGAVHPRSRVPVRATLVGGAITLMLVLAVSFEALAGLSSALTLAVFAAVNAALFAMKRRESRSDPRATLRVPKWISFVGALACTSLLAFALST